MTSTRPPPGGGARSVVLHEPLTAIMTSRLSSPFFLSPLQILETQTVPVVQKTDSEKETQPTIPNMFTSTLKNHPDGEEQKTRERALALWMGRTGLPVRTVEDKDFIKMMEVVDKNFIIPKKTK